MCLVAKRPGKFVSDVLLERGELIHGKPVRLHPAGKRLLAQPAPDFVGQFSKLANGQP